MDGCRTSGHDNDRSNRVHVFGCLGKLSAAAFFALCAFVSAAHAEWTIEGADAPRSFSDFYPRALAVDPNRNPHMAYGGDHLYYAYFDGLAWHHETVDDSFQVGRFASIAMDSNNRIHIGYYDAANGDLKYATNASGRWVAATVDSAGDVGQYSSIAVDSNNKAHIGYYDNTSLDLKYATSASGRWVAAVVDSAGDVGKFASIDVDSANRAHMAYYDSTNQDLKYSTNASGRWAATVADSAGDVGKYASIDVDSADRAHIGFYDDTNQSLRYATDASGQWAAATVDSAGDVGQYASIAAGPGNKAHISYYDNSNFDLRHATNASGAWAAETVDSAGGVGTFTSMGVDSDGGAHIVYFSGTGGELRYASNRSGSWATTAVDSAGNFGQHSDIAVDANGRVHVSYYDSTNLDLRYATNASGVWAAYTLDSEGNVGRNTSIALDSKGKAHISYHDATNGDLKYATNASGPWAISVIDPAGMVGQFSSIAVDSKDRVHISYQDGSMADLKYASNASGAWAAATVDAVGAVGQYSSLALGSNDSAHISYQDGTNSDLKYATNASGQWVTYTVDPVGTTGQYTSIAVAPDGKAHISYQDVSNADLKYATNASGQWAATTVDAAGMVGQFTSIAVGADGKAHISYFDDTNDDLKYATNSSGPWAASAVDSAGSVGQHSSIAVDAKGMLHVSYYDDTSDDLKYATTADVAPPSTLASPAGGVYSAAQSVALTCEDKAGSGCDKVFYCTGAGCSPTRTYTGAITVSASTDLRFYSTDRAGNSGPVVTARYVVNPSYREFAAETVDGPKAVSDLYQRALAIGGDNKPQAVYGGDNLYYAVHDGAKWLRETVDDSPRVGKFASVALDPNNKAHVSYYDAANANLKYATNASGVWVKSTIDSAGDVGAFASIALDTNGKVHIAYHDSTNGDLRYTTNAAGSWVKSTIDSAGVVGQYTSVDLDRAGKVHIAYFDATNGDLKYATNSSGSWIITVLDTSGTVGQYASIALDAGGKAHVSYHDATNGDLRYASNSSGEWTTATVDSAGAVGLYTSIAVGATGKVYIGYYSTTGTDLVLASYVSGAWKTSTLDSAGDVGRFASIALDRSGRVHAAYFDAAGSALKYATNADFTPPATAASPPGGSFKDAQEVSLSCSDGTGSGCEVVYLCLGAGCSPMYIYGGGPISVSATTEVRFFSIDSEGNREAVKTAKFEIDTEAPDAPVVSAVSPTNDTSVTWGWSSGGGGNGAFRYQLDTDAGAWAETAATTFVPSSPLAEGVHTLYVQERDEAGNWSVSGKRAVTIDITAPGAPVVSGAALVASPTPTWTWAAGKGGVGTFRYKFDDGNLASGATEATSLSYTPPGPLAEGTHTLYVQERDEAGNWSASGVMAIAVDTTAPAAPSIIGTSPIPDTTPTWTWSAGGGGNGTFRYKLDDDNLASGAAETASSSYTPAGPLAEGAHTLYVQEKDEAGNWSTSGSRAVVIDITAPKAPAVSGASPTNDTMLTWSWSSGGEGNGAFRYQLDGEAGAWSETSDTTFIPPAPLAEGAHTLYAQERDEAGNWSASGTRTVTIDVTAPSAPAVGGDSLSADPTPTWTWAAGGGGNGTFRHQFDGEAGPWAETAALAYTPTGAIAEGKHVLYVQEKDDAGNWSASGTKAVVVDVTPPSPPVVSGASPTNDTMPGWSWAAGGGGSGAFRHQLDGEAGPWSETAALAFMPALELTEGAHTLYVQERDEAGNWSASGKMAVAIDITAPRPPAVSGATPTNDTTPGWSWATGGGGSGAFRYRLDGEAGPWTETAALAYAPIAALAEGPHVLYVQERDEVGNWSASGSRAVLVDITSPMQPLVSGQTPTNDTTPALSWASGGGGNGTFRYKIDDATMAAGAVETTALAFTPSSALSEGLHTLYIQERDEAGNWSASGTTAVTVDITSPKPPAVNGATPTNDTTPAWTWATGGGGSGQFRYQLDGESGAWSDTVAASFTPSSALAEGAHTLYIQERDEAGNWSTSGSRAVVVDITPPKPPVASGSTPTNDTTPTWTWAAGGGGNGSFRYKLDDGNLATGATETAALAFAPASALAEGTHTLHIQERDDAGNWSASGSRAVVVDITPPKSPMASGATPTNDVAPTWAWVSGGGGGNGTFRYRLDDADLSAGAAETTSVTFAPPSALAEGTHTLYIQERDEAGNWSTSGSRAITVDITSPKPPAVSGATPTNDTTPAWTWATGGGGSGQFRYQLDGESGAWSDTVAASFTPPSALAEGAHTLYIQERDEAGNWSTSGNRAITVDITPPKPPVASGTTPTNDTTPTWSWAAGGGGNGQFRYKLDDSGLKSGAIETAALSLTPAASLTEGAHTLYIQERDEAGNWSEPGSKAITVDITPPGPPVASGLSPTNDVSPTWSWATGGGGNGQFRYRLDNGDLSAGAAETTSVTFAPPSALAEGTHTLYVQERDDAGNWSQAGNRAIVVDTTAPGAPTVSGVGPTSDATPTWTWAAGGGGSGTFRYKLDDSDLGSGALETKAASYSPAKALGGGTHTLYIQEGDEAGNWSQPGSRSIRVDTTAPSAPYVRAASPTADATPAWEWASGGGGGNGQFRYKLDNADLSSGATETSSTSYMPAAALEEGDHALYVQERDDAGNWSPLGVRAVIVDTAAPSAPLVGGLSPTKDATPTWTWASGGGGNGTFRHRLDNADLTAGATETTNTSYTPSAPLADGNHTLYVQERDDAGNWSAPVSRAIVVEGGRPAPSRR